MSPMRGLRLFLAILTVEFLVISAGLAWLARGGPEQLRLAWSAWTGVALVAVLVASSSVIIDWGKNKPQRTFMTAVVATILGKMTLIGLALIVLLRYSSWPRGAFLAGLLGGWIVFSAPWVVILSRPGAGGAGGHRP